MHEDFFQPAVTNTQISKHLYKNARLGPIVLAEADVSGRVGLAMSRRYLTSSEHEQAPRPWFDAMLELNAAYFYQN